MDKVVLWGYGNGYDSFVSFGGLNKVEVVGLTDKNKIYVKRIDGVPVFSSVEIVNKQIEYDYIVVTVDNDETYKAIVKELVDSGISRDIIIPSRVFSIPFFSFEEYIEIKNSNVSILSDYCFAGLLYHRLGLQHTSPTINMWADNDNFFRFISDIENNIKQPMVQIDNTLDEPYRGIYSYFRGRTGECEWNLNHDIYFESAVERWKKGCERFNLDNYIVTMTLKSDEMAYKFNELPIENKMGFYWKELNLKSVLCLSDWNSEIVRAKYNYEFQNLANALTYDLGYRGINWMKLLLHKSDYLRME